MTISYKKNWNFLIGKETNKQELRKISHNGFAKIERMNTLESVTEAKLCKNFVCTKG